MPSHNHVTLLETEVAPCTQLISLQLVACSPDTLQATRDPAVYIQSSCLGYGASALISIQTGMTVCSKPPKASSKLSEHQHKRGRCIGTASTPVQVIWKTVKASVIFSHSDLAMEATVLCYELGCGMSRDNLLQYT